MTTPCITFNQCLEYEIRSWSLLTEALSWVFPGWVMPRMVRRAKRKYAKYVASVKYQYKETPFIKL